MNRLTHRLSVLLLVFTLLLPNSVLALRTEAGLEARGGLEELQSALLPATSAAGLEEGALVRILIADQPQRPNVPDAIRELIQSMGLQGHVELIEEQGKAGNQRLLKQLIEKYEPTIILVFTGKSTLLDPFVVAAANQHKVRLVIRAGAGYENLSMERTVRDDIPFFRSHGLRDSMTDYTLRGGIFAGLRLLAGTSSSPEEGDVSQDTQLKPLFQMSPADFDEALRQATERKRGEMTTDQKKWMFGSLSRREFLELIPLLAGQRVGILGFGEIGQEVAIRLRKIQKLAKKLKKVSFEIAAASPSLLNPTSKEAALARQIGGIHIISPEELYQTSDILTIHVPSSDANRGLIRPELFEGRTKRLILIDTARWDLMHPAMFETKLPFEMIFLGDVDFIDSNGVVDQRVLDLRAAHPTTFVVAPHIGGLTSGSAEGALRNLLDALRRVFPVLLGQADPASIETINKRPIVPVVSTAGLEEDVAPSFSVPNVLISAVPTEIAQNLLRDLWLDRIKISNVDVGRVSEIHLFLREGEKVERPEIDATYVTISPSDVVTRVSSVELQISKALILKGVARQPRWNLQAHVELVDDALNVSVFLAPAAGLEELVERMDGYRSAIKTKTPVVIGGELAGRFLGLQVLAGMEEDVMIARKDPMATVIRLVERGVTRVHYFGGLEEAEQFAPIARRLGIEVTAHTPQNPAFRFLLLEVLRGLGVTGEIITAGLERFSAGLEELAEAA